LDKKRYFEVGFLVVLTGAVAIAILAFNFVSTSREQPVEVAAGEFIREFGVASAEDIKAHFLLHTTEDPSWNDDYQTAINCIRVFGRVLDWDFPNFSHSSKIEPISVHESDKESTDIFIVFTRYENGNARFELEYVGNILQLARFSASCEAIDSSDGLELEFGI